MKKLFYLQFNWIQDIWSCHTASSYSLALVVSNKSKKATVKVAPSPWVLWDWQEGSARVRLQSEAFSFSEAQDLIRPVLKTSFLCTACVSTVLMPMYCKLNAFKTYRHMVLCPSILFLPRFFNWVFSSRQVTEQAPPCFPLARGCSVLSLILSAPSSCLGAPGLLPWPQVSQARGTVSFFPQEKRLQESSQPGLRKGDVLPHSPELR